LRGARVEDKVWGHVYRPSTHHNHLPFYLSRDHHFPHVPPLRRCIDASIR
jgi:hypothetical protein